MPGTWAGGPYAGQRGQEAAAAPGGAEGQVERDPPHPGLGQLVPGHLAPARGRPGEGLLSDVLGVGQVPGHPRSWTTSGR
jgi:hypothetical protein